MYFIYFFIICYTTLLVSSVNTYVVLAANLNDFKSLAKKFIPNKNLANQIKVMVLETDDKHNSELADETFEYIEEEQEDTDEIVKPVYKYQVKKPPRVSLFQPKDLSPTIRVTAPKTTALDELIDKLKHGILQEIIENGDDNTQLDTQVNNAFAKQLKAAVNKNVKGKPKKKVENSVPVKVFKEVQFEGTFEDTTEKHEQPKIHYLGQVQIPKKYLKNKAVKDFSYTKTAVSKNYNRFVSPKNFKPGQNVKYYKQVLVPAKSNKKINKNSLKTNWLQQLIQQPRLDQQPYTVKQTLLEPELSLKQQSSEIQLPLDQQPSIIKHLAAMQQQIDRLTKITQQNMEKDTQMFEPTTTLKSPQVAGEVSFKIVSSQNPEGEEDVADEDKTSEDHVLIEDDTLSEETTNEPAVTETNTDFVPTTENEQFVEDELTETSGNEEDTLVNAENDNVSTTETALEGVTETNLNDEQETAADDATNLAETILVKADNAASLGEVSKKHTQEFGNQAAGEPIVEKTYNFNVPIAEPNQKSVPLEMPVNSARKVMLF